ncbi:hypothetical protein [Domibacillus mangrovi]|uniref:hypothetical protein n=1 Tax=Domibacillus mangrovi TaxID=1714354 RepID=UPI000A79090D|nr:hypothetical protein [Domibacillus mangrovi]
MKEKSIKYSMDNEWPASLFYLITIYSDKKLSILHKRARELHNDGLFQQSIFS